MGRRAATAIAACAGIALLLSLGVAIGRTAIEVQTPRPGQRVGAGGLELLVRFGAAARVEPATVRVLLNGADVTAGCVAGRNGVAGRLEGLLDGDNRVRVEAFARGPDGLLVQLSREVHVVFRPPLDFDRG